MVTFLGSAVEAVMSMPRLSPPQVLALAALLLVVAPVGVVAATGPSPADPASVGAGAPDSPLDAANATREVTPAPNRTNYLMPDTGTVRDE